MGFVNTEQEDLFVNIIGEKQKTNKGYEEALAMSCSKDEVTYKPRETQKPSGYIKIISSVFLIVAISFGSVKINDKIKNNEALFAASEKMAVYVKDNTIYGDYNPDAGEFYWWYDIDKMAKDILNSNDFDIDTRIYGCFRNLKDYQKIATMDDLFKTFQKIINENPNLYSEDVIRACSFSSFQEYLDSKNLNIDEYTDKMSKILEAYGRSDTYITAALDKLDELDINGGTR